MNVLMATDGSQHATDALRSACRVLRGDDRVVKVICVAAEPWGAKSGRHVDGIRRRMLSKAQRILEKARGLLAEEGVGAQTVAKSGSPAKVLIRESRNCDLIAMGAASHRAGDSAAGLGPVASRIAEHSSASVFVGRQMRGQAGVRILAPVDGSDTTLRALKRLGGLVDLSSADVTLMHVVETPWLHSGQEEDWAGDEDEDEADAPADPESQIEKEFEQEAGTLVEEARRCLPGRTAVTTVIERGLPADMILSEADREDYDLVVLSASGSSDLKHEILGSVSTKVAWNAPCSVLLIRSGG